MRKFEPADSAATPTADPQPAADARELLLYVEDDEENWRVTEFRLRKSYRLLWARTATEAIELLRAHGADISAILMDIQLQTSSVDGVELTRALRAGTSGGGDGGSALAPISIPIIFVTAHTASTSERELIEAGGNRLITKPVNFPSLALALGSLQPRKPLSRDKP